MMKATGNYSKIGARILALKKEIGQKQIKIALQKLGPLLEESNRQSIMKQRMPDGEPFEPISYPYRPSKRTDGAIIVGPPGTPGMVKTKPGDKALLNHGSLQKSLSWQYESGGEIQLLKIGANASKQAEKLKKHHYGTPGDALHMSVGKKKNTFYYKNIKPFVRRVLGFSIWARHNGKTDRESIVAYFKTMLRTSIELTRVT